MTGCAWAILNVIILFAIGYRVTRMHDRFFRDSEILLAIPFVIFAVEALLGIVARLSTGHQQVGRNIIWMVTWTVIAFLPLVVLNLAVMWWSG